MTGAFEWIGQLVNWLGAFIPRWTIVRTTHGAVKFVKGKKAVALGPGLHFFWPLVTELDTYPVARQSANLKTQSISTLDGKTVAVGAMIVYEIKDIKAILAETYDPEETIKDIALGAVHDVVCHRTLETLLQEQRSGELDRALRRETKRDLDKYGVHVLRTTLTDLAPCRVIRLLSSTAAD